MSSKTPSGIVFTAVAAFLIAIALLVLAVFGHPAVNGKRTDADRSAATNLVERNVVEPVPQPNTNELVTFVSKQSAFDQERQFLAWPNKEHVVLPGGGVLVRLTDEEWELVRYHYSDWLSTNAIALYGRKPGKTNAPAMAATNTAAAYAEDEFNLQFMKALHARDGRISASVGCKAVKFGYLLRDIGVGEDELEEVIQAIATYTNSDSGSNFNYRMNQIKNKYLP